MSFFLWCWGNNLSFFSISRVLRSEKKLIKSIQQLGFSSKEAIELISDSVLSGGDDAKDTVSDVFDVRDTPEAPFITWWNDLEEDSRYDGWPSDIMEVNDMFLWGKNLFLTV